jgi:hypothetical protein
MAAKRHEYYNTDNFPHLVCRHGNWDIYRNGRNACAAIPSAVGEVLGCNATQFGDMQYVRIALSRELAEAVASGESVRA